MATLNKSELNLLKDTLDAAHSEFRLLEYDNEWYCSDTLDLLASSRELVYTNLGLELPDQEEEDKDE
jgi:uncharacterized protein YbaP (TraB family)